MIYISLNYYVLVITSLLLYYAFPKKIRWTVLLSADIVFYVAFFKSGLWIFLCTITFSFIAANLMPKLENGRRKAAFIIGLLGVITPWMIIKNSNFLIADILKLNPIDYIVPIGISFYTLQLISYLADVYMNKVEPERNLAKYTLFVSFFPQIIQGPIPRYAQLHPQLIEGHLFDEEKFVKGFQKVIWGFFLKLVIADKAAVIVNTVFDNYPAYSGTYIWLASFLYSIQLYTDFLSCTTLAQGVAGMFGIELVNNFQRPYFSVSIKDFWRRWHVSLSEWLRDYIYIPLGGNRSGKCRKYLNLIITFLVSGIWHGAGLKFILWGLVHALYQIVGELSFSIREKMYSFCAISDNSNKKRWIKSVGTFLLVNWAWIIFRADSLKKGAMLLGHMFIDFNPWVLFNDRLFTLGLEWKEIVVLAVAIYVLRKVGKYQEQGKSVGDRIYRQPLIIRWGIYITAIVGVILFGTYGFGFDAQDFIYGGF